MDETQHFDIDLEKIVPEYYSRHKFVQKIFFERFKHALFYLNKIKPLSVLDAGCGDGLFTKQVSLLPFVKSVVGIDLNVNTEILNKKGSKARFQKADLLNLTLQKKFDVITCLDVLEHFENAELVLRQLKKVLKKDGFLIVSGPVESFWYKLGRLAVKGSFSQETGPGAGKHYYNIIQLNKLIKKHFICVRKKRVNFLFIHLFDVILYRNK